MTNVFSLADARSVEPDEFVVGDFVQWKRESLRQTYSTGYTAEYVARLMNASPVVNALAQDCLVELESCTTDAGTTSEIKIAQAAGTTDSYFLFSAASTATADFVPGEYRWQLEITETSTSNRAVVERGRWTVNPDFDSASADPRTLAERMLDEIENTLCNRASSDSASYSIEGRSLQRIPILELLQWRDKFRGEVAKQRNDALLARGKKGSATIQVRF